MFASQARDTRRDVQDKKFRRDLEKVQIISESILTEMHQ